MIALICKFILLAVLSYSFFDNIRNHGNVVTEKVNAWQYSAVIILVLILLYFSNFFK